MYHTLWISLTLLELVQQLLQALYCSRTPSLYIIYSCYKYVATCSSNYIAIFSTACTSKYTHSIQRLQCFKMRTWHKCKTRVTPSRSVSQKSSLPRVYNNILEGRGSILLYYSTVYQGSATFVVLSRVHNKVVLFVSWGFTVYLATLFHNSHIHTNTAASPTHV